MKCSNSIFAETEKHCIVKDKAEIKQMTTLIQLSEIYLAVKASVDRLITHSAEKLPLLLAAIIVFFIVWIAVKIFRAAALKTAKRIKLDPQLRILLGRLIAIFGGIIATLTSLSVIVDSFSFGQLLAGLGFGSFVVGFATKDILNNFLSGILVLWQRPFQIGDHLTIGTNQGKVEAIGIRATSLRKDDGELILIPNADMYSSALTIRGAGDRRRLNFSITVSFNADVELTKKEIEAAVNGTDGVLDNPAPKVFISTFSAEGIEFTAKFWIDSKVSSPIEVLDIAAAESAKLLKKAGIRPFAEEN